MSGLRELAATRGEWALVAELLDREIEAANDAETRARLHIELAQVYEEHVLDVDGAIRNYASAMELDPRGVTPPAALARLLALAQRFEEAALAEESAAGLEVYPRLRAERLLHAGEHMQRVGNVDEARRLFTAAAAPPAVVTLPQSRSPRPPASPATAETVA